VSDPGEGCPRYEAPDADEAYAGLDLGRGDEELPADVREALALDAATYAGNAIARARWRLARATRRITGGLARMSAERRGRR
jgi:hypothetical protein